MSVIIGTGQQVLAAPWRIPTLKRVMPLATSSRNQVYEFELLLVPVSHTVARTVIRVGP